MTTNPFENPEGNYFVLVNADGQHSLWPAFADVPAGWDVALRDVNRDTALDYVADNWTDMRPKSLVETYGSAEVAPRSR